MKVQRKKLALDLGRQRAAFMFGFEWDNDVDALDIGIYFWPLALLITWDRIPEEYYKAMATFIEANEEK